MMFTLWYSIWITLASTIGAFVIPVLAVLLRYTFMNQSVRIVRVSQIAMFAVVFIVIRATGNSTYYSVILTLRIFAFMLLASVLWRYVEVWPIERMPLWLAQIVFVYSRWGQFVFDVVLDMEYSIKARSGERLCLPFWRRISWVVRLWFLAIRNVFVAAVRMTGQISSILSARGGLPHPKYWGTFEKSRTNPIATMIGDVCLLLLLAVGLYSSPGTFVPSSILEAVNSALVVLGSVF